MSDPTASPAPRPRLRPEVLVITALAALTRFVALYHPRAVIRFEGSEAEPDLMVRAVPPGVHS